VRVGKIRIDAPQPLNSEMALRQLPAL